MLNDVVSDNDNGNNAKLFNNIIIPLLTDSDYFLDKKFDIQFIDENELTGMCHLLLPIDSSLLKNAIKHCSKKFGTDIELSNYMNAAISEYNKRFEIHHLTTSSLVYDGRKPRVDVLEQLESICTTLDNDIESVEITEGLLRSVIRTALGHRDQRTLDKYFNCIKSFAEQKSGQKLHWREKINVDGLHELVLRALEENIC